MAEYEAPEDKGNMGSEPIFGKKRSQSPTKSLATEFANGKPVKVRRYGFPLKRIGLVMGAILAIGGAAKVLPDNPHILPNDAVASIQHVSHTVEHTVETVIGINTMTNGQRALAEAEANKDKSPEARMIYDALVDLEQQPGYTETDKIATDFTNGKQMSGEEMSSASSESTSEATQTASNTSPSDIPIYMRQESHNPNADYDPVLDGPKGP